MDITSVEVKLKLGAALLGGKKFSEAANLSRYLFEFLRLILS